MTYKLFDPEAYAEQVRTALELSRIADCWIEARSLLEDVRDELAECPAETPALARINEFLDRTRQND